MRTMHGASWPMRPLKPPCGHHAARMLPPCAPCGPQIDSLLGAVDGTLDYSRGLHAKNMSSFSAAQSDLSRHQ